MSWVGAVILFILGLCAIFAVARVAIPLLGGCITGIVKLCLKPIEMIRNMFF